MKYEDTEQKLVETDFNSIETQLAVKLPSSFKKHYIENNGGYPPFETVKGINHILYSINSFYPIKYGRLPIEKIIVSFKESNINLGKKIPFAYDNGGNVYLLSLDDDQYFQKILLIEAEFLKDYNYHIVANSFSEFIENLT